MRVTSSIIPDLNILYPHMGPPTTPGPQGPPPSKSGAACDCADRFFVHNCFFGRARVSWSPYFCILLWFSQFGTCT